MLQTRSRCWLRRSRAAAKPPTRRRSGRSAQMMPLQRRVAACEKPMIWHGATRLCRRVLRLGVTHLPVAAQSKFPPCRSSGDSGCQVQHAPFLHLLSPPHAATCASLGVVVLPVTRVGLRHHPACRRPSELWGDASSCRPRRTACGLTWRRVARRGSPMPRLATSWLPTSVPSAGRYEVCQTKLILRGRDSDKIQQQPSRVHRGYLICFRSPGGGYCTQQASRLTVSQVMVALDEDPSCPAQNSAWRPQDRCPVLLSAISRVLVDAGCGSASSDGDEERRAGAHVARAGRLPIRSPGLPRTFVRCDCGSHAGSDVGAQLFLCGIRALRTLRRSLARRQACATDARYDAGLSSRGRHVPDNM